MSSGSKREREQRKKLQHFLTDLALLGSLQGFRYFQPWLRGREELLLTVVNEDLGWRSPGFMVSAASSFISSSSSSSTSSTYSLASDASSPLPGDHQVPHQGPQGPQSMPRKQQHSSQGPNHHTHKGSSEAHLLPASPSEREIAVPEVNCTLFLLAGYAKYGRPYAWIRSNHERLVNIGGTDSMVKDTPMKLKAITDWGSQGIRVWDVVSELVCLCTVPSPSNPFALDMRYLKSLPLPERFLVSGALLNFLETYAVYGNRDELHYNKVIEEMKSLRRLHVQTLSEVQRRPGRSTRPATPVSGESSEEE